MSVLSMANSTNDVFGNPYDVTANRSDRDGSAPSSNGNNNSNNNSGSLRGLFGILNAINPSSNSPTNSSANSQLEYLFEDEYVQTGPSWGARLCYGAGITYLTGLSVGGTWGLLDGIRNPIGQTSRRLRWNSIVNGCTARGPWVANHVAMVALLYNLIHGGLIRLRKNKEDALGSVASAAAAGMIFKSTKGWRASGMTGVALGALMATYRGLEFYLDSSRVRL